MIAIGAIVTGVGLFLGWVLAAMRKQSDAAARDIWRREGIELPDE